jgi:acyl-[acyl carrier protein]--UDP-N-acetylglucosamine O-acyltransferase
MARLVIFGAGDIARLAHAYFTRDSEHEVVAFTVDFVLEDNTIQPGVRIGDDVTLWSGNHIGHDSVIADHCFISSHVVVSGWVRIGSYCSSASAVMPRRPHSAIVGERSQAGTRP